MGNLALFRHDIWLLYEPIYCKVHDGSHSVDAQQYVARVLGDFICSACVFISVHTFRDEIVLQGNLRKRRGKNYTMEQRNENGRDRPEQD